MLQIRKPHLCAIAFIGWTGLAAAPSASAQTAPSGDHWQWTIAPYLMGVSLDGTTVIKGREADLNVSSSDIFHHLDFGFMGMLAARKGNWGVGGDLVLADLDVTTDTPSARFDPTLGILTLRGLYRLTPNAELTFGGRWNHLDGHLELRAPINLEVEQTRDWVDPIVGVTLRTSGGHKWHGALMTDIGGTSSDNLTWQFFPFAGYKLSPKVSLDFGWRLLETDHQTGEGSDEFEYDMLYQGPVVGMVISL